LKIYARITGTGSYLPEKILTNAELAARVDTSDEWIQQRTGITQRHIAADNEDAATMGTNAAKRALAAAGLTADDLSMIIVATCTPPQMFPATACLIQAQLGVNKHIPAFDVQAACSGFVYILSIATKFIESGTVKNVLLIGSEVMSRVIDWQDRATCVLFGDGAGAVVLSASDKPGVISTNLYADGSDKDILYLNNAKMFATPSYLMMEGRAVFRLAVKRLASIASEELKLNNIAIKDLDWVVPHQANLRIIQATVESLGLREDQVIVTVDKHANTSGASIPIALDTGVSLGKIKPGHNILFEAFGGGLTWASAIVRF
jgi:3-oxoacyl-[acyl-carrier-protein] synthase-3